MNLPTVKQLRYYVALEEKGHFGKAAAACFVSQSAFSVAIRELESLLDTQLVDRTNRNVTVTAVWKLWRKSPRETGHRSPVSCSWG